MTGLRVWMPGLGDKIKQCRKAAGFTQRKMAKALGIPFSTYSNYENGNRTPDVETIHKICAILDIPVEDIMGRATGPIHDDIPPVRRWPEMRLPFTPENMLRLAQLQMIEKCYDSLNEMGKKKLFERLDELMQMPRYVKENETPPPDNTESGKNEG